MKILNRLLLSLRIITSKKPRKVILRELNLQPRVLNQYIPTEVFNNRLLAEKNVLITGAGQNIGRAIAHEMAKQGANIYFTDIDEEKCEKLEKELIDYNVASMGFTSDISSVEDSNSVYEYLVGNNINIDVLVNNAGMMFDKKGIGISEFTLEEWEKTYSTNVFGPMHLTKKISDNMIKNSLKGSIIFITSIHQEYIGQWTCYSSTKAALAMIVKELAAELAKYSIRVNGIAPGWVRLDERGNSIHYEFNKLHNSSIDPQFIGRGALFLASDYFSKYTTGTILKIDSGHTLVNFGDLNKI